MKDPIYTPAPHEGAACSICGGAVVDEDRHTSFHKALALLLGVDED